MHHEDIKAAIRKKGVTPADIAEHLQVSNATVSAVIRGITVSQRVASAISSITGLPVDQLWPGRYEGPPDGAKTVALLIKRAPAQTTPRSAARTTPRTRTTRSPA